MSICSTFTGIVYYALLQDRLVLLVFLFFAVGDLANKISTIRENVHGDLTPDLYRMLFLIPGYNIQKERNNLSQFNVNTFVIHQQTMFPTKVQVRIQCIKTLWKTINCVNK